MEQSIVLNILIKRWRKEIDRGSSYLSPLTSKDLDSIELWISTLKPNELLRLQFLVEAANQQGADDNY
jgi:hypothetical protein